MSQPRESGTLSPTQRRALLTVERMVTSNEHIAHDLCGDLSMCSGNWPATANGLARRGLIEQHFEPIAMDGERWTYSLTPLGSETCVALRSQG